MKHILIFSIFYLITLNPAISHDEEIYTSEGQWTLSSGDENFVKSEDQNILSHKSPEDELAGRYLYDQEDVTDDYQLHAIYILASDSRDAKYDVNGIIENIVLKANKHLKKNTDQKQFRLDLTKAGKLDVSFIRVDKTRREINKLENGAGYFTGIAIANGFYSPKKLYTIFYQDKYKREWGQVGDALFDTPNGEIEVNSGVVYMGAESKNEAWVPHTHELLHALGFVQLCAPGAVNERNSRWGKNDHLNYTNDMMSDRGGDKEYIDRGRKDYYDHSNPDCEMDFKNSAFLEPTEIDFQLQPFSPSCKLTRWQPKYKHDHSLSCLSRLIF